MDRSRRVHRRHCAQHRRGRRYGRPEGINDLDTGVHWLSTWLDWRDVHADDPHRRHRYPERAGEGRHEHDASADTEQAGDGIRGMELALNAQVDLLLLDLVLPGRGGLEILEEVRAVRPTLPVIIITGYMYLDGALIMTTDAVVVREEIPV